MKCLLFPVKRFYRTQAHAIGSGLVPKQLILKPHGSLTYTRFNSYRPAGSPPSPPINPERPERSRS